MKKTVTYEQLIALLSDPKTNWKLLLEQMTDIMCDVNYKKYLKFLKDGGNYLDVCRKGHGIG